MNALLGQIEAMYIRNQLLLLFFPKKTDNDMKCCFKNTFKFTKSKRQVLSLLQFNRARENISCIFIIHQIKFLGHHNTPSVDVVTKLSEGVNIYWK